MVRSFRAVAFSDDRQRFATSGTDGRIKLWRVAQNVPERTIEFATRCLSWGKDQATLTAVSEKAPIEVVQFQFGGAGQDLVASLGSTHVTRIDWSADGSQLALAGRDESLHLWTEAGLRQLAPSRIDAADEPGCSVAWTDDGRLLTAGPDVRLWGREGSSARAVAPNLRLRDATISPDGAWIAGVNPRTQLTEMWSPDGKPGRSFPGRSLDFAPDSNRYSMMNADNTEMRVVNADGTAGAVLPLGPRGFWTSGRRWHPNGKAIAITKLGIVHHWDLDKPPHARLLVDVGTESVGAPCYSPDGAWLAVANAQRILLFDDAGKQNLRWSAHRDQIASMAWSPDSRWLASAGTDHALRLWTPLGKAGPVFCAPALNLRRIAWGKSGHLAGINFAGDIFVWNYEKGNITPAWVGFLIDQKSVAFNAQGKLLIGDPGVIEEQFLFLVENTQRVLQPLRYSEFLARYPELLK